MHFLAFFLLVLGAVLALPAANKIIKHDDGSNQVMIQYSSGFVLLVASVTVGVTSL